MNVRVVREVDVKIDKETQHRKITASRWWVMVPRSLSEDHHKIFSKKSKVDYGKSTPDTLCYFFGDHSKGALGIAWDCFQKAMELP